MPYFYYPQIQIGAIAIYTWGFFVALSFLICYWLVLREASKKNIKQEVILLLFVFVFFGAILGSRLGYVLQYSNYYFSNFLEIFKFTDGGLTFHGGLIGALIAGFLYYLKRKKQFNLSFLQLGDMIAPIAALGITIGRIGCSLINDHQGAITSLPWAIIWPDGFLRHPVAEYLLLNGLIMFFVLLFLKRKIKKTGYLFIIFLIWYSIARFLLDFTRVSNACSADPQYFGLFISQWVSLFILIGLGAVFLKKRIQLV